MFLVLLLLAAAQGIAQGAEARWVSRTAGPLTLWSPASLEQQIDELARDANVWLPRLQRDLGPQPNGHTPGFHIAVVDRSAWRLAGADLSVEESAIRRLDMRAPSWAAGYMLPADRIGVVRLDRVQTYPFDGTATTLAHEVSHQLLYDRVGRRVPRWFDEAVATSLGRRRGLRDVAVLLQSSLFADIPPLQGLDYEFLRNEPRARRAYAASLEFLDWAQRRYDDRSASGVSSPRFIERVVTSMTLDSASSFEAAWRRAGGESLLLAEQTWRQGRWRLDRWVPVLFMNPTLFWAALAALAVLAAFVRRLRSRRIRERWAKEEELEELEEELLASNWSGPASGNLVN